ncbi:MAG TPA: carboxypeptidase-like regulatory domain-containing protein [Bryobacteraceae bacterium]|nr:carboxypeptidase-like regulatory domain-containing protein [Bryobacteraceae bacterium]
MHLPLPRRMLLFFPLGVCLGWQTQPPTTGTIAGTVMNEATGVPIAGARVKLTPLETEAEPLYGRTDAQGRFEFANLHPGHYGFAAESPGLSRSGQNSCCVDLKAGGQRVALTVSLSPYAVISGKLTDFNGIPITDSQIGILRKRPKSEARGLFDQALPDGQNMLVQTNEARTDDRGEFRAARVEPGTYYLVANNSHLGPWEDRANRITYYPHALDFASARPLEVSAGQQVRADIQIARQTGVRVAGRLLKTARDESASASYSYTNVTLVPEQNSLANANGLFTISRSDRFELTDILPGKYRLLAVTREQHDVWGADAKIVLTAARLIEVADKDVEGLDIELQPSRDLSGVATFTEGCAPVPVRIEAHAFGPLASTVGSVATGSDGKFVLSGFAPGHISLNISAIPGTSSAANPLSATLGDRDVLRDGFDYPFAADAVLRIVMGCANGGPR